MSKKLNNSIENKIEKNDLLFELAVSDEHHNSWELGEVCGNCTYFIGTSEYDNWGVCGYDEAFDVYFDDIMEMDSFSHCYDLFLEKRIGTDGEACDRYEEIEMISEEEYEAEIKLEQMKNQDMNEIIGYLYSKNKQIVSRGIATIDIYFRLKNKGAHEGLLNYYMSLGPAEDLAEVHRRIKIIGVFSSAENDKRIIEAYVRELYRTPSNNTSRQLYRAILDRLSYCDSIIVDNLLTELLNKKTFAPKMKKRIIETIDLSYDREFPEMWRDM